PEYLFRPPEDVPSTSSRSDSLKSLRRSVLEMQIAGSVVLKNQQPNERCILYGGIGVRVTSRRTQISKAAAPHDTRLKSSLSRGRRCAAELAARHPVSFKGESRRDTAQAGRSDLRCASITLG